MPDRKTAASMPLHGMRGLNWHQLEFFRAVARTGHITRAAEQMGVSQPALSRALAKLEASLGVPLYERIGRSIRLTRYGELFGGRVERAIREIEDGYTELAELADPHRGKIALGFLRSLGSRYVPQLVREFARAQPAVQFSFVQNNSGALEEQLLDGTLDLIFSSPPLAHEAIEHTPLDAQELRLLLAQSHRLARRRSLPLRAVADEPFVCFKPGHAFRLLTEELCQNAGFVPKIGFEGDDSSSVPGFVAAGFGVAIVAIDAPTMPGTVALRISEPTARRTIVVAWAKDRYLSAAARSFRDFARSRAGGAGRRG